MTAPFKIVKIAGAWWPVHWAEPLDGGELAECRIEVKFRRVPWSATVGTLDLTPLEFCRRFVLDWRGIADENDQPVRPWASTEGPPAEWLGSEALAEMLERPAFYAGILNGFAAFLQALPETRQGNSAASPAGGPAAGGSTGAPPAGSTS